jgi:hypothetical protein
VPGLTYCAAHFGFLTWISDDTSTRRRVDPVHMGYRIDPRHASGRLRAARCWSSPRAACLCHSGTSRAAVVGGFPAGGLRRAAATFGAGAGQLLSADG